MHDMGCLGLLHWDDPEGWYGEEGGGGFRMGNMFMLIFMMIDMITKEKIIEVLIGK